MTNEDEVELTPREELIAQRAAKLAIEKVYTEIGRSVVKRIYWAIGVAVVGIFIWLAGTGAINR